LEQAVAAAMVSELHQSTNRARMNLAALHYDEGDLLAALPEYEAVLVGMQATSDSFGESRVLHAIATIRHELGDPAAALDLFTEAIAIKERLGDIQGAATSRHSRSQALRSLDRIDEARQLAERAVAENGRTGEKWAQGNFLDGLGLIELVAGTAVAESLFLQSGEIAAEIGAPHLSTLVDIHRAVGALSRDDVDTAVQLTAGVSVQGADMTAELELAFVRAAIAWARDDNATAQAIAQRMLDRATEKHYGGYERAARALLTGRPAGRDLPRILWVERDPAR